MADRDGTNNKVKAILAAIMGRNQPKPDPEKSHFDRPEPDREAERKQALRKKTLSSNGKPIAGVTSNPAEPHWLAKNIDKARRPFDIVSESGKIKERQKFESRFKTDAKREAAIEAMDDAAVLRQAAILKNQKANDAILDAIKRHPAHMVFPPEWGSDINRQYEAVRQTFNREMAEIEDQLTYALQSIALRDIKVNIGPKPAPPRLEYTTLAIEGPDVVDADFVEDDGFEPETRKPWTAYPDGAIVSVNDDHDFVEQFNEVAEHLPPDDRGGFKPGL